MIIKLLDLIDKHLRSNCLTHFSLFLTVIWFSIIFVWSSFGEYSISNYHILSIFFMLCLIILIFSILIFYQIIYTKSYCLSFILIISTIFTVYTYFSVFYLHEYNTLLDTGLLCLLIVFNTHFIFVLFTKHYPSIKKDIKMFKVKICLNYYYLLCIMIFIVFSVFFVHFAFHFDDFEASFTSNYFLKFHNNFAFYYIYSYFLTFLLLATTAVQVWLNLSISYPVMLFLIRKKCVDLRKRSLQKFFLNLKNYFAETTCLYLFLLLGTIITYKMPSVGPDLAQLIPMFQYEEIVLSLIIFINITFNFLCFLRLNLLVQDYVSDRYQKIYTQFCDGIETLEYTDKQIPILNSIANPFSIRYNSIFILSEIALVLSPILQLIFNIYFINKH